MERSNNLLRAYESERWLSCTPSARLEEGLSQTKDMGDEKTAVRGLSDIMLR